MATEYTGTVLGLIVSQTSAKFGLQPKSGGPGIFVLYNDTDAEIPDRVTQSIWLAILRDAKANGGFVTVYTASNNSAVVTGIGT